MTKIKKKLSHHYGHLAEWIAALYLRLIGYRILAKRFKTPSGEIDIIAAKNHRLISVEVKARMAFSSLPEALSSTQHRRCKTATEFFLSRHPKLLHNEVRYDMIWVWGVVVCRHFKGLTD